MASDRTAPKRHAFVTEAGAPDALLPCPTCRQLMALDLLHALAAVDAGTLPSNRSVRWAEASHLDPATAGGKLVALECNRCNRRRGDAPWTPPAGTLTYVQGKRRAYDAANALALASRGRLQALGYLER